MTPPFKFTVDPWDPSYGISADLADLDPSSASINLDIEVPGQRWTARIPAQDPTDAVLFVDGVRRIEAHVWISVDDYTSDTGICASYAAGAVRCDGAATICEVEVGRGLFSASSAVQDVQTAVGEFPARMAASATPEALALAVQERMGAVERAVAERARAECETGLIVVDGPLRGRAHLPAAVGLIKTHHVAYLPQSQHRLVGALAPGQRTPVFTLGTSWSRHSWYARLPGASGAPWAGVVRCECSAELAPHAAVQLADVATATLPRYASSQYKDARAPQNLYPIGALERELRHRLGDQQVIYRALRSASHRTGTTG